jgi:hypothetical protein
MTHLPFFVTDVLRKEREKTASLTLTASFLLSFLPSFQALTIRGSILDDQGSYSCEVEDHSGNRQKKSEFVRVLEKEQPYLRIYTEAYHQMVTNTEDDDGEEAGNVGGSSSRKKKNVPVQWVVQIESHPEPKVQW